MAYSKTNWVDNTTPIDKDNLNKIEQGIYDNSLVVDAVTNTLNPTDTETYKTAELTEGQITDVIGVSDILIKGQTSQDGTPTPDSPVDINVVSGSNVINTSNRNVLPNNIQSQIINGLTCVRNSDGTIVINGTSTAITYFDLTTNFDTSKFVGYKFYGFSYSGHTSNIDVRISESNRTALQDLGQNGATLANNGIKIVALRIGNNTTLNNFTFKPMLIAPSETSTEYEPHQGKELPLDLPVENLFDVNISNANGTSLTNNGITLTYKDGYINLKGTATAQTDFYLFGTWSGTTSFINLKAGQYAISITTSNKSIRFYINKTSATISVTNTATGVNTFTLNENTDVTSSFIRIPSGTTINENVYLQIEEGSKANAYTPYGTTPIELCKIGNYQDYFYKSGSKWYLHKEIGKITLNGNESGGWTLRETNTNTMRLTADGLSSLGILAYNQVYSKVFKGYSSNADMSNIDIPSIAPRDTGVGLTVRFPVSIATTVDGFKTWLASNLPFVYCATSNITNTEITDTTLISQLEAIYNAPLYEETNITQTNNDLPMVLDITACKDNINGLKAFIRK